MQVACITLSRVDLNMKKRRNTLNKEKILSLFKKHHLLDGVTLTKMCKEMDEATVYRNLKRFVIDGVIREVKIGKEKTFYELSNRAHHHHLVCEKCGAIIGFRPSPSVESFVGKFEKVLEQKSGFQIKNHSFEFFGICKNCMNE